ncbi:MAG TPA: HD domain-containing phosphohydrolase [Acidothermaceae bacterium]|nr:HD domain-containing phosphohydrolase [Acidothermaceae bacterium]
MTTHAAGSANLLVRRTVVIGVALGCVVALGFTLAHGVVRLDVAAAFVALIAVGELLQVRLPGDRPAAPIAASAALGYALLFAVGGQPVSQPIAQVAGVVGVGVAAGAGIQVLAGRRWHASVAVRRVVSAVVAGLVFRTTAPHSLATLRVSQYKNDLRWVALLMVAVVALTGIVDLAIGAFVRSSGRRVAFGWMLRDEIGAGAGLWAAVGATGVLMALATPSMNLYALPIFCVPLLLTQFAFRRYAAIRTTYRQTIRSLSRVAEVGGYVETGHAHRVSSLAVAVGREMGLAETEITDLEYAALLHDIGQLSLTDPIPGGSTLVVAPVERRRVAELGADVIKTTGVLDRVADIVARQADPYRRHREAPDESLPIESRIIKAVSAYDDLVGESQGPESTADALERLRLGMAYEYDPAVVETLTRIVAS